MKNGTQMEENLKNDIFTKYLEIKQDVVNNIPSIFNRQLTFSRKYRGNMLTDINVGFYLLEYQNHAVQIFIRHNNHWIKDVMVFNNKNKYLYSDIKTTLRDYE
jgi:hypothetical protein